MSIMSLNRINYLRDEIEGENISWGELAEINDAFLEIPEEELPEPRENAMASDQLDELELRVTPFEREMYEYIKEHFGESEAKDPCYDLGSLANHLEGKFDIKEK